MDNKERVLSTMIQAGRPLKAGEISELSGLDKKEVDKAMNMLKAEGKIVTPKRCFWEPGKH